MNLKYRVKESLKRLEEEIYSDNCDDMDKVMFAFGMVSKILERRENLADELYELFKQDDAEGVGKLIITLMELQLREEASQDAQLKVENDLDQVRGYVDEN